MLQQVTVRVHLDLGGNEQDVDLYLALVGLYFIYYSPIDMQILIYIDIFAL